jgi:hypothetical protein
MKKNLLMLFCCVLFSLAAYASAVEIIIHDIPGDYEFGPGLKKDKTECMSIIEAEDGNTTPTVGFFEGGPDNRHLYLLSSGASVTVTCEEPTDVIYVQSSGSDRNDGTADYYVDGVKVTSVQTYMMGVWYLEIRGLEETAHTVTVVANPGHVNLDYFGFGDMPTPVDVDIKPGSCPNPLNIKEKCSKDILPVAILGAEDFDVNTIDTASIRLIGVAPRCSRYEDVASLVTDQNECACTTAGPDGLVDLTLKFNKQDVINAIGDANDGEVLQLVLTGNLIDGTKIEGTDCVTIINKDFKDHHKDKHHRHGKECSHHRKDCRKNCRKQCHED